MKRLLSIAAVLALAAAKPEMYKENEEFQYSRSSTDEGSKSGFYGAQRGNMGGNYEKAHNMDGLAQNQMSGLVRQVEGELGDGSNTRTGSVYTAANSRGVYGNSGKYDLSNLQGRNFQEGTTFGDSHSHSSLASHNSAYTGQSASSMHSSAYNAQSHNSGYSAYHGTKNQAQLHAGNLQAIDNTQAATGTHGYGYGVGQARNQLSQSTSHSAGNYAQSGYQSQSEYDSNHNNQHISTYGVNPQSRIIVATPVRVYGRPGQRVAIPVGAQIYDASHASTVDQNAINSEAEVLNNADQHINSYRPTGAGKRYESSYSYRKQWEKHSTSPEAIALAVPTENPFPNKNSELYDDSQTLTSNQQVHSSGLHSQTAQSSNAYNYNSQAASSLSQTKHHSGSQAQYHTGAAQTNSNAYTHGGYNAGSLVDGTNALEDTDSRPRSYQSSYSYHKSWERQGDPYVIQPVGGPPQIDQQSQRLTANSNNGYSSHKYGTHYSAGHATQIDCDENGHMRVARSANNDYQVHQNYEELGQQTQNGWERPADLQQINNNWQNFGQPRNHYNNRPEKLEDLGQQSHNTWENLGQETQQNREFNQFERVEDLGQHSQNNWDQHQDGQRQTGMGQYTRQAWVNGEKLEDINQQSQLVDGHWVTTGQTRQELEHPWLLQQQQNTDQQNDFHLFTNGQSISDNDHPFMPQSQQSIHNAHNTIYNQNRYKVERADIGQQTQHSWSFDNVLDDHKNKSIGTDFWTQSSHGQTHNARDPFSSFDSLWDKINAFEETSTASSNTTAQESSRVPTQYTQQSMWNTWNQHTYHSESGFGQSSNQNDTNDFIHSTYRHRNAVQTSTDISNGVTTVTTPTPITSSTSTSKPLNQTRTDSIRPSVTTVMTTTPTPITSSTSTSKPLNQTRTESIRPSDIGRGDIGPEESFEPFGPMEVVVPNPKEKTPEEIEALSMTVEKENKNNSNITKTEPTDKLNAPNQSQNKQSAFSNHLSSSENEDQRIEFKDLFNSSSSHEEAINNLEQQSQDFLHAEQISNIEQETGNFDQETGNFEQEAGNFEQQTGNLDQQTGNLEQQTGDFEQQTGNLEQQTRNFEQQTGNFEQNTGNFEQQSGKFDQHFEQQSGKFDLHFDQVPGNIEQISKFEQENGNFEQQTGNFEQQTGNFEQHTGNFEQQSGKFDQQPGHFDQAPGNIEQIGKFEQVTGNFEQQSGNFEQQTGHFNQVPGNIEQQIGNFEQQTGNLEQQIGNSDQHTTNFEENSKSLEKQTDNFEQQTGNIEQHSGDFEQRTGNFEQQGDNFEQQSDVEKQISMNDQQSNKLYQQSENLNQQSDTFWGQDAQEFVNTPLSPQHYGRNVEHDERTQQQSSGLQKTEDFHRFNEKQTDFYKENHPSQIRNNDFLENDKLLEDIKTAHNAESKAETPVETGFWKSVGSKLSNAKTKVASWFTRS